MTVCFLLVLYAVSDLTRVPLVPSAFTGKGNGMDNKSSVQRTCIVRNPKDWCGKEEELGSSWVRGRCSGCSLLLFQQYLKIHISLREELQSQREAKVQSFPRCRGNLRGTCVIVVSKGRQSYINKTKKNPFQN